MMKNYNKILEAVNKGIQIALDDYEDMEDNKSISQQSDIIDINDKDSYKFWQETQDNKLVKKLVEELIFLFSNISVFSNKGDLPKTYESRTIEIFDEIDKIYKKWGRFLYKRKIATINANKLDTLGRFSGQCGTLQSILSYALSGHTGFITNMNLNWVDVSDETDLSNLFQYCEKLENLNISDWDVSNVKNFSELFYGCYNLKTCDLSNWDVSNAVDTKRMFAYCKKFNPHVEKWNMSNVQCTREMFDECENFNRNISNWYMPNNTNMTGMFHNCKKFNQKIGKWDVSKVEYVDGVLDGCTTFLQDLSTWDLTGTYKYDHICKIKHIAEETPIENKAYKSFWPKFYIK